MRHWHCSRSSAAARVGAAICCCGLLILAGCNSGRSLGKLVPVQGKITLANGDPLPDGQVMFVRIDRDPKAPYSPEGKIEANGSYTLATERKPGAPPGKYRVVLSRGADKKAWSRVPSYYSQPKSPLEVEVVENKPEGGYDLKLLPRDGQLP